MTCPKCNSENVKVETVSNVNSRGGKVPLWYWFSIILPMIDICLIVRPIYKGLKRSSCKTKTKIETVGVCQDCGNTFKIKK